MMIESKRKKLKVIVSLILFTFIITGLLIKRVSQTSAAWYNASWLYRRSITITGDGSSHSDENVVITVDTASLITASKLQPDCDDIRFTASDGSTALNYWIEGGCNTTTTQIWVLVPSVSSGSTTIYMYYNNSSASTGEQTWSNNFISLSDASSCQTGWSRYSTLDGRFPRGSSTAGSTGGSTTHTHSISDISMASASSGSGTNASCTFNCTAVSPGIPSHTHTLSNSSISTSSDHTPEYVNTLFCSSSKLDIESNHITLFDTAPSGWTRYSTLDDKYPRGASSSIGSSGGSSSHTHTLSASLSTYSGTGVNTLITSPSGGVYDPPLNSAIHSHTLSATITGSNDPVLTNFVLFYKKNNTDQLSTERPIYMFDSSSIPPYGWDLVPSLNDNGYIKGSTSYNSITSNILHGHSGSVNTSTYFGIDRGAPSNTDLTVATGGHYHSVSYSSSFLGLTPPYATVVFAKRKSSLATSLNSEESNNLAPTAPTSALAENQANPTNVSDTTPEFSAIFQDPNAGDTGTHYEIEVNTNSSFTGTVMWDSSQQSMTSTSIGARSPDISYGNSNLTTDGSLYYWRIRFWDNNGAMGAWSSTQNFRMQRQPSSPTDLLTDGNTNPIMILSLTPSFSAIHNDVNGNNANYYEIEINSNSSFTETVMWDTDKTSMTSTASGARCPDITYAGTALTGTSGTTYYWRIRYWDTDNLMGDWSATATFDDIINHQYIKGLQMKGLQIN